jgi:hypothetical protein
VNTIEWFKKWGKKIFFGGVILLLLVGGIKLIAGKDSKRDTVKPVVPAIATDSGKKYVASYDFSATKGPADSKTFTVPAGDGWVLVALPAYYRATFSWPTECDGELDKLAGGKPVAFRKGKSTEFGDIPMAIALRVPEGCVVTISFVKQ